MTDAKRRVKVYSFSESREWEDIGTGHVSMAFVERLQSLTIIVRSEEDCSILLESKVLPGRVYRIQEETLIVWTEDESCDLALSFQEKTGCNALWAKICEIQGCSPSVTVTQEFSEDSDFSPRYENTSIAIELPPCELGRLDDIFELVTSAVPSLMARENLALAIERENYIPKLLELFHVCEDLENKDGLHHLYNIFRTLFLINRTSLLSIMFQDDAIMDVIGCLEYDPTKSHPVRHREYLAKTSQHREVIPINSPGLMAKIHQTYRVQYIQEVILPTPSLFEENRMSSLNAFILFNKAEIINGLQTDTQFLRDMFTQLADDNTSDEKFRELSHLLHEVCTFSLALESEDRTKFYQKLCSFGFMDAVEGMLTCEDKAVVSAVVDVLLSIAEFNCSLLRDHILHQSEVMEEDGHFLNIVISLLIDGQFIDIDVQLVGLIKTIIDPENIMTESGGAQTVEKSVFLSYFYKHCMHRLMAPLMAQTTSSTVSKDTAQNAVLISHTLDLLSLCVERHSYHIRNYIIEKNVLSRVLVLMTSVHGHLMLAALRFCRRIVGLKDEFYHRYIVRHNLLAPVVTAFLDNGKRYNLINSAVIELFEFITSEKQRTLIQYVMDQFMPMLDEVEYVDTFKKLRRCHEQGEELAENPPNQVGIIYDGTEGGRFRRDPRQVDEDEEAWFDDEEENVAPLTNLTSSPQPDMLLTATAPSPTHPPFTLSSYSPRPAQALKAMARANPMDPKLPTITAALQSLADYNEDSDEENSEDETPSPAKQRKLDNT